METNERLDAIEKTLREVQFRVNEIHDACSFIVRTIDWQFPEFSTKQPIKLQIEDMETLLIEIAKKVGA